MLLSTAAATASLKGDYGTARSANAPASFTCHLYDGDPLAGGVELAATGGYAAVTVANTDANFTVVDGVMSAAPNFGTASADWPVDPRWWVLKSGATLWEGGPLGDEVSVTAGSVVVVTITTGYADGGED